MQEKYKSNHLKIKDIIFTCFIGTISALIMMVEVPLFFIPLPFLKYDISAVFSAFVVLNYNFPTLSIALLLTIKELIFFIFKGQIIGVIVDFILSFIFLILIKRKKFILSATLPVVASILVSSTAVFLYLGIPFEVIFSRKFIGWIIIFNIFKWSLNSFLTFLITRKKLNRGTEE